MIKRNRYYEYEWLKDENKEISVSLGEGETELRLASFGMRNMFSYPNLWIKHEEQNPTGCFKDRESACVMSEAKRRGYTKVVVASSGNAALSTAAYAQKAMIDCHVYIPKKTTQAKRAMIIQYGAKLFEIDGFYEDVYRHVVDNPIPDCWNVTSGQNPWRTEGNKTIAYEIWKQLSHVPDYVVVPSGNGGCLAGIWKGFDELFSAGLVQKIPKMVAVQVDGAAPLLSAFEQGVDLVNLGDVEDSVAEGIVASESYCSPMALEAIKSSNGRVITVSDSEIIETLKYLVNEANIVVEPTSAAAFAALYKLKVPKSTEIVVISTGSGVKMIEEIMRMVGGESRGVKMEEI